MKEFIRAVEESLLRDGYFYSADTPFEFVDQEQCSSMLKKIVNKIGSIIPQNDRGDLIVRVENKGQDYSDPKVRGHLTNAELPFHSDRTDLIFLLYLCNSEVGGNVKLVDVRQVHENLKFKNQNVISTLREKFPNHGKNGQTGVCDWVMLPIMFGDSQNIYCRYIRRFIEESQLITDSPRLTDEQVEALNTFDEELNKVENQIIISPGKKSLLVIDNFRMLHAREPFASHERRLALRAWASHANSPDLPACFSTIYHETIGGTYRGGFCHLDGFNKRVGLAIEAKSDL